MGRENSSGLNDRYSPDRYGGYKGEGSLNQTPRTGSVTFDIADPAGNYDSVEQIPAGAVTETTVVTVTQVFNGVPTLIVGHAGDTNLCVELAEVDLTALGTTRVRRESAWGAVARVARATVGGAPNQGAGTVTIYYVF